MEETKKEELKSFASSKDVDIESAYYISTKNKENPKKIFLKDVINVNKNTWKQGKNIIISLVGCQNLASYEGLVEKKIETNITPTVGNHQQHVVNIWLGYIGNNDSDYWTRASGEASTLNTGNVVDKKMTERASIDSQYKYSMADKRAYCRAVLKQLRLFGVYSAVEAQAFNKDKDNLDF